MSSGPAQAECRSRGRLVALCGGAERRARGKARTAALPQAISPDPFWGEGQVPVEPRRMLRVALGPDGLAYFRQAAMGPNPCLRMFGGSSTSSCETVTGTRPRAFRIGNACWSAAIDG